MEQLTSDAWVLHQGNGDKIPVPAELSREDFSYSDINADEVLAEPLYGCWEGNMTHALSRKPVDICRLRREKTVVLGNAGVVRVLKTGENIKGLKEGDNCFIFCNAEQDEHGYTIKVLAFDAPRTMGVLAKRIKIKSHCLIPIPKDTKYSLQQWAAFSLRYVTAWSNWNVAYGCWKLQMSGAETQQPYVVGWGGGVTLGELLLAKSQGCKVAMITSQSDRLGELAKMGIAGIDRRTFPDLNFDGEKYRTDMQFKTRYLQSEKKFMEVVREVGDGQDASIFLDHIGAPVFPATLKALGRQGVLATCGWKEGAEMTGFMRSTECNRRRLHVHTHYARYSEGIAAAIHAEETGWLPPVENHVYKWDDIPHLAREYGAGRVSSYFPIFQINAE